MDLNKHKKIVLDTDPGVDDAMALAFLAAHPLADIVAITTVFGNADVEVTTRNALFLAEKFGVSAPVYMGARAPLAIQRRVSAFKVHGRDGMGDTGVASHFAGLAAPGAAHERLVQLIHANPNEISILAIGPLTNLALALRHDPSIAPLVREVVVMGGAFGWGKRRGNVSPVAEANIANDPHAAEIVFSASWPVTVVGLDVTMECILGRAQAVKLAENAGQTGKFLWEISRSYEEIYRTHDGFDGCCIHDVAAAACLMEPGLFEMSYGPIKVVTRDFTIGQTIQKPDTQAFPPGDWDNLPSQKVCIEVDHTLLIEMYIQSIVKSNAEVFDISSVDAKISG